MIGEREKAILKEAKKFHENFLEVSSLFNDEELDTLVEILRCKNHECKTYVEELYKAVMEKDLDRIEELKKELKSLYIISKS